MSAEESFTDAMAARESAAPPAAVVEAAPVAAPAVVVPTAAPVAPANGAARLAPVAPVKPGQPRKDWGKALSALEKNLQLEAQVKELGTKAARLDALLAQAKADPLKLLEETGLTYNDIAAAKVKQLGIKPADNAAPAPAPVVELKPLEDKIAGIEKKITDADAAALKRQSEQVQRETQTYIANIGAGLKERAAEFPLINAFSGAPALIWERIKANHAATGKVATAEEIAPLLEKEIGERLEAFKTANPAIIARLAPAAAPVERPTGDAPSGVGRTRRPTWQPSAPTIPVAIAKPEAAPVVEKESAGHAPGGAKKQPGETFADYMARIGK